LSFPDAGCPDIPHRQFQFNITAQQNQPRGGKTEQNREKWRQTVPKPMACIVELCYNLLRVMNDAVEIGRFGLLHG
jgi:hypothetical protein